MRTRDEIKQVIEQALRKEFPTDTVDVSDGYKENIHVIVVSRRFDAMAERESTEYVWDLVSKSGLTEDEQALVSLVLPTSPSLLK